MTDTIASVCHTTLFESSVSIPKVHDLDRFRVQRQMSPALGCPLRDGRMRHFVGSLKSAVGGLEIILDSVN